MRKRPLPAIFSVHARNNHIAATAFILGLLSNSCALADTSPYAIYEMKLTDCVRQEQMKPALTVADLAGISKQTFAIAAFYLKDQRIVDCSAHEELSALAYALATVPQDSADALTELSDLKQRYLSIELVKKRAQFVQLPASEQKAFLTGADGKSLEINLIDLFDQIAE